MKLAKQSSLRNRGSKLHTRGDDPPTQKSAARFDDCYRLPDFVPRPQLRRVSDLGVAQCAGARMQFANFPNRRTTSSTRHGQYLFRGELLRFHAYMMHLCNLKKCSILLISAH